MRVVVVKTCAVLAVFVTALAMAQSSAPSQPGAPSQNSGVLAAGQNTPPASSGGTAQTIAATPDTRTPNVPANPADQVIQRQVQAQFAHKAEFQNITVNVEDGVVTLEGSVPTKVERRQAKALARSVNGVKKVQEHLTLSGAGVSGPGTFANTTTSAQNNAGSVSGNTSAQAGTVQGTSAMSQTPSSSAAPSLNPGTQPANATTGTTGGTTGGMTGVAVGASPSTAPPSSNVGTGASNPTQPPPPAARVTAPARRSQPESFGLSNVDTAGLVSKINAALKHDPNLANNNVMVNVSDKGVEVTGSVDTGKEKLTAMRIAQSYAGNFKVIDRVTLAGHTPTTNAQQQASQPQQANTSAPPSNVVGNQVLPGGAARNIPTTNPKTAGDKSSNPR